MYRMPTEWEYDVAKTYVNERQIYRPPTNIKTALIAALLFILATGILVWLTYHILTTFDLIAYMPSTAKDFHANHRTLSIITLCIFVILVESFFCFKHAVIGAIKLYQHYAAEEVRRRCLFMPTCSEYAIMAVRKYGGIIGLCKSYYRLKYLFRGNIYKIHYP